MKMKNYLGDFTGWGKTTTPDYNDSTQYNSVMGQFAPCQMEKEPTYVYANYARYSYDGSAIVIYKRGSKWFYVTSSHCSCYGLENSWEPEEFKPADHFKALKQGKRIITFYGSDESEVDRWLEWAVKDAKTKAKRAKERKAKEEAKLDALMHDGEPNQ